MTCHFYAKQTERIDVFDDVLDTSGLPASSLRFSSEHDRAWHVLDGVTGSMAGGDILCVPDLETLGDSSSDISARMEAIMAKRCGIVIASIPATYEFGLDLLLNKAVASAIIQGLQSGEAGARPFVRQAGPGRPRLVFPDGWDELYARWEAGEIGSKEFLTASGLKKATFYNKLADYKALRAFNMGYLVDHGIA